MLTGFVALNALLCYRAVSTAAYKERKGNEEYLHSAFLHQGTQSSQSWITQFYLQTTPCLPFLHERSPDGTTTATEAAELSRHPIAADGVRDSREYNYIS